MANSERVLRSAFNGSTRTNNELLNNIRDRQTMRRTIIKQGYLKKLPNAARLGASIKKVEKRWFVFGIIGSTDPYLEYYENEDSIFASRPLNIMFLDTCVKITKNQKTSRHCNIFTLVLTDRLLSLVAPTRDAMYEWSRAIEQKLSSLGIIEEPSRGNNDYIRVPFSMKRPIQNLDNTQTTTQDHVDQEERVYLDVQASGGTFAMVLAEEEQDELNEPFYVNLPRTPAEYLGLLEAARFPGGPSTAADDDNAYLTAAEVDENSGDVYANANYSGRPEIEADVLKLVRSLTVTSSDLSDPDPDQTSEPNSDSLSVESVSPPGHPAFVVGLSGGDRAPAPKFSPSPEDKSTGTSGELDDGCFPLYEEGNFLPRTSPTGNFSRYCELGVLSPPPKTPKIIRRNFVDDDETSSADTREDNDGCLSSAPPSSSSSSFSQKPHPREVPLQKHPQLQKLIREMKDPSGTLVVIPKAQCRNTIAFVECFNRIWIGGWNQRLCPTFQSFLHIGDQLVSINDSIPTSRSSAMKLLKLCSSSSSSSSGRMDATLHIRRLPCGQVFGFNRENGSTNSLGLTMVNRTAEIDLVDPTGLARENGLEERAPAMNGAGGGGDESWWVTEVNNQPINLFSKDDEAKQRLNASGSHISFVVQPTQLVAEIKRQLRNTKGFRDFLVH